MTFVSIVEIPKGILEGLSLDLKKRIVRDRFDQDIDKILKGMCDNK